MAGFLWRIGACLRASLKIAQIIRYKSGNPEYDNNEVKFSKKSSAGFLGCHGINRATAIAVERCFDAILVL